MQFQTYYDKVNEAYDNAYKNTFEKVGLQIFIQQTQKITYDMRFDTDITKAQYNQMIQYINDLIIQLKECDPRDDYDNFDDLNENYDNYLNDDYPNY